ncbi:transglycosylase SLT domain-containing protein [Streptomyces sp. SL13]|uniref:Transglycosylase SLT domain-containing protein n=1 Tax=Streptantibioticus silvisoli TaxID=2705255 RepID=A0AA90H169_9ACTN|nr:transglycosylase SLT domain-containing protein [Streptantibioticus silvisoli]MDI5969004.1 transglycosylase SLT domain-containing protein [Streptantibioticus silvisoli]
MRRATTARAAVIASAVLLGTAFAAPAMAAAPAAHHSTVKPAYACSSTPGSGDAVTQWNPVVSCVLGMLGQPASTELINDVDIVILHESSGDPNAVNNWDENAQEGHPSTGLVQVIQPTFDAYKSADLADNLFDPAANIFAGMNYAINRYGSIQNIPGVVAVNNGGTYVGYVVPRS